jgi:hypothetical protein
LPFFVRAERVEEIREAEPLAEREALCVGGLLHELSQVASASRLRAAAIEVRGQPTASRLIQGDCAHVIVASRSHYEERQLGSFMNEGEQRTVRLEKHAPGSG